MSPCRRRRTRARPACRRRRAAGRTTCGTSPCRRAGSLCRCSCRPAASGPARCSSRAGSRLGATPSRRSRAPPRRPGHRARSATPHRSRWWCGRSPPRTRPRSRRRRARSNARRSAWTLRLLPKVNPLCGVIPPEERPFNVEGAACGPERDPGATLEPFPHGEVMLGVLAGAHLAPELAEQAEALGDDVVLVDRLQVLLAGADEGEGGEVRGVLEYAG